MWILLPVSCATAIPLVYLSEVCDDAKTEQLKLQSQLQRKFEGNTTKHAGSLEWCIYSDTQLKAAGNFMFIIFASHILCADPETWNLVQLRFQRSCRSGILEIFMMAGNTLNTKTFWVSQKMCHYPVTQMALHFLDHPL